MAKSKTKVKDNQAVEAAPAVDIKNSQESASSSPAPSANTYEDILAMINKATGGK